RLDKSVRSDAINFGRRRSVGLLVPNRQTVPIRTQRNLGGHAAMNQVSHNEPFQYGNSICAEPMIRAERELSAFISAVTELFGSEQAALAAKDWLQQLEVITDLPTSTCDWRLMSIEASARLAKRVNSNGC